MAVWKGVASISHPSLGGLGSNTWHCRTTTGQAPGDHVQLDSLTDSLHTLYTALIGNWAGGAKVDFSGQWVQIDDGSNLIINAPAFSVVNGTSQAPLPPASCLVVSWHTSHATKRARGRTFCGPMGTNTLETDGTIKAVVQADAVTAANAFIDSFDGVGTGAFGVWSTVDHLLRDFTAATVRKPYAVLRSRRD